MYIKNTLGKESIYNFKKISNLCQVPIHLSGTEAAALLLSSDPKPHNSLYFNGIFANTITNTKNI